MKKIFEDMVPNNRKTIRDIEIPNRNDSKRISVTDAASSSTKTTSTSSIASLYGAQSSVENTPSDKLTNNVGSNWTDGYRVPQGSIPPVNKSRTIKNTPRNIFRNKASIFIAIASVSLIAGLLFLWTYVFSKVTIDVTPRSKEVTLDKATFIAQKGSLKDSLVSGLSYEVITLSEEGMKKVAPSGERQVERASSGKIMVYNAYSNKPQRLIRNSRFETKSGLIFRITDSVSVPGKTVVNGEEIPGSIEAVVVADTAGDKGNISLSDFTIPGFKGDPRYTKLFARSLEPMTGGYIGVEKVVSDDILHKTQAEVQSETLSKLVKQARGGLETDKVIFDSGIYSETQMLPSSEDGNMVKVSAKVTLYGVVFSKSSLAKSIAEANISPFDNSPVTLTDLDGVTFLITNKDQVRPWIDTDISFTLTGKATISWIFDENKLKESLLGKPRPSFYAILPNFQSISTATPHFSPGWKSTFPNSPESITIIKSKK